MKLLAVLAVVTVAYIGLMLLAGVAIDRLVPIDSLHSLNLDGAA